jgi:hypothetical protein
MNFMDHQGIQSMERLRLKTTDATIDAPREPSQKH